MKLLIYGPWRQWQVQSVNPSLHISAVTSDSISQPWGTNCTAVFLRHWTGLSRMVCLVWSGLSGLSGGQLVCLVVSWSVSSGLLVGGCSFDCSLLGTRIVALSVRTSAQPIPCSVLNALKSLCQQRWERKTNTDPCNRRARVWSYFPGSVACLLRSPHDQFKRRGVLVTSLVN